MDLFFCPFRTTRSKKSSSNQHPSNRTNNNVINGSTTNTVSTNSESIPTSTRHSTSTTNNNNNNTNNSNSNDSTGIKNHKISNKPITNEVLNVESSVLANKVGMYRYVTEEFKAKAIDEINVFPGDLVIYEFSDEGPDGAWAYVLCTRNSERGFVPAQILSTEPVRGIQCKKKIPRSQLEPMGSSNQNNFHRAHNHPVTGQLSSNSENIHFHHHQHPTDLNSRFGVSHSLRSSSGNHSFQKYPDPIHLCPSTCYNIRNSDPRFDCCDNDSRLFIRENLGLYVALHNFVAREENDLNVMPYDVVTLLNRDDDDWFWVRRDDRKEGFVPSKFICDYDHVKSFREKGNSTATARSSNMNDCHTYINHIPDKESLPTDILSSIS